MKRGDVTAIIILCACSLYIVPGAFLYLMQGWKGVQAGALMVTFIVIALALAIYCAMKFGIGPS